MNYAECLARVYNVNKTYKLVKQGLENMQRLDQALGYPSRAGYKIVHVAGTNGKGSVCWKVSNALTASGMRTGLFVSPHISSFRERCLIDGKEISEKELVTYLNHIFQVCETNNIPATFFEIVVSTTLLHFAESNVDAAVLEAGLGGRLDATNVIRESWMSVITNIGLDHTRVLGTNKNAICWEKAGIIKEGGKLCVGRNVPLSVVEPLCRHKNATLLKPPSALTDPSNFDTVNTDLSRYIVENLLGKDTMNTMKDLIEPALHKRPPCRLQHVRLDSGLDVILDVAHNPPAFEVLFETLNKEYSKRRIRVVVALSGLKDALECMKIVYAQDSLISLYLTKSAHDKAMPVHTLQEETKRAASKDLVKANFQGFETIDLALEAAERDAKESDDLLVVCGSVYMMPEVRAALNVPQLRDPL